MEPDAMDEYYIYDNRLASFAGPQHVPGKRRGSNASSRAPKALSWPHKSLEPADMAKAGFVFTPLPSNPDNVTCFLCTKALDGWEQDDDPLEEHLKHSPECGWAITAAVEAEMGGYAAEDPRDALMVEARKATFGDKWPHESRKGWSSVKVKALVEAGWKYAPLVGSEDNATCAYCHLALDGWEKSDKPWDEHYNRAPHCPFFNLISSKPAPKRAGRSKAARSSKASRLSLQSTANGLPDMALLADISANIDDSVMTTASTVAPASKASTKAVKGRKAPTSRAKKTRAKNNEAVEIHEDVLEPEPVPEPEPEHMEEVAPTPIAKPVRGRKRTSDEIEDSVLTNAEAPVPKKRTTKPRKARGSTATEASSADAEMTEGSQPIKKPAAKSATRKASSTRKPSGRSTRKVSVSTVASTASPPPQMPDDEEIDQQLEADLERPLDDDDDVSMDADSETKQDAMNLAREDNLLAHTAKTDFAMFDPNQPEPTDEEIEADLQVMQDEMDVHVKEENPHQAPDSQELKVPKKSRKAGTRKVSKQTATKKAKEVAAPTSEPPQPPRITANDEEPDEIAEAEVSFASSGTVKRTSVGRASLGRASLPLAAANGVASVASVAPTTKAPAKRGRPRKVSQVADEDPIEEPSKAGSDSDSVVYPTLDAMEVDQNEDAVPSKTTGKRAKKHVSQEAVDPVEITQFPPQKKESQGPAEEPADLAPSSDSVVYPTLEAVVDDEPTPKPVVKTATKKTTGKPRGRPPKPKGPSISSEEPMIVQASAEPELKPKPETSVQTSVEVEDTHIAEIPPPTVDSPRVARKPVPPPKDSPVAIQRKSIELAPSDSPGLLAAPETPRHHTNPTQSAKQATISPSPSPQASDAENRPPSSKPGTNSSKSKRMPLSELPVSTPARQISPSKQQQQQGKVIAGLQSTEQWTAVDLELIFETENTAAAQFFAEGGKLSGNERGMTVEEWIYYNAGQAEQKLKIECEAMVNVFEREGTRAMRVLEGLVVDE